MKIDDQVEDPTYKGVFNFKDSANEEIEYEYDKNGNLVKDLNKNISKIEYNLLNLPSKITFGDGKTITYVFDASGVKLLASYKTAHPASSHTIAYCGNMIYEDDTFKQVLLDGGYITFTDTKPMYHYYLKDHLGNNRVVVSSKGEVEQVNHYYPYGGIMAESTNESVQRYKYNGKELDRMHGLDWYDYGARWMADGRFTTTKSAFYIKYKGAEVRCVAKFWGYQHNTHIVGPGEYTRIGINLWQDQLEKLHITKNVDIENLEKMITVCYKYDSRDKVPNPLKVPKIEVKNYGTVELLYDKRYAPEPEWMIKNPNLHGFTAAGWAKTKIMKNNKRTT